MRVGSYMEEQDVQEVCQQVYAGISSWCNIHCHTAELRKHDAEVMRKAVAMVIAGLAVVPKYDGVTEAG